MSVRKNRHHNLLRQPKPAQPFLKKLTQSSPGRWLGLALGLTGVATISATAGALLAVSLSTTPLMQQKLTPEEAAIFSGGQMARGNLRFPELTRPVNILVLGIKVLTSEVEDEEELPIGADDLGYHALVDSFKGLSDTMLLLRFDPAEKKLKVLSVPRDTRTYVEGVGMTKINDANYYGGPALSAKATSELLGGVGIDRYVRVNVQGVEKLIDALGGLDIYVPKDMKYTDESQHLYIDLEQGQHHLNGAEVLQFLRFRKDNLGDIGRVQRQQILMRSFMDQALNVATISRLPKLVSIIQSHIDTNLSLEELVALVSFATNIERESVEMLMVPGEFSSVKEYGSSYWLPDYSRLDSILAKHFDFGYDSWRFENVDSRDLRIAIQDSTDDWDAVDNLVIKLNNDGFWNVKVSKPWTQPLEETRIVAQDGDTDGAEAIQKALGFGKVVVESTGFLESDVTIQLGRDWLEKSAQQEFEVDIDSEYEDTDEIDTEEREDFEDFQPRRRNRYN